MLSCGIGICEMASWIGLTDESEENLISIYESVQSWIESFLCRHICPAFYSEYFDIHENQSEIILSELNIIAISELTDNLLSGPTLVDPDYYEIYPLLGKVKLNTLGQQYFTEGKHQVSCDYTAGLSPFPADIKLGFLKLAQVVGAQKVSDPSLKSEKIGDYSYTKWKFSESWAEIKALLNPYKAY
ncbi:unnamed protein product [marine sediment metagenome]|uniref:Uncharacterized protein n=1 Tax=marine sediment metagenome TaxID=412755 RepID=X1LCT5_9ZZZZ